MVETACPKETRNRIGSLILQLVFEVVPERACAIFALTAASLLCCASLSAAAAAGSSLQVIEIALRAASISGVDGRNLGRRGQCASVITKARSQPSVSLV